MSLTPSIRSRFTFPPEAPIRQARAGWPVRPGRPRQAGGQVQAGQGAQTRCSECTIVQAETSGTQPPIGRYTSSRRRRRGIPRFGPSRGTNLNQNGTFRVETSIPMSEDPQESDPIE